MKIRTLLLLSTLLLGCRPVEVRGAADAARSSESTLAPSEFQAQPIAERPGSLKSGAGVVLPITDGKGTGTGGAGENRITGKPHAPFAWAAARHHLPWSEAPAQRPIADRGTSGAGLRGFFPTAPPARG